MIGGVQCNISIGKQITFYASWMMTYFASLKLGLHVDVIEVPFSISI